MSAVDKTPQRTPVDIPPLTVPEALASLLVAAVAVDGTVMLEEAVRIGSLIGTSRILREAGNGSTQGLANRAIARLTEYGLPAVLTVCAKVIPADLRPTAFALAIDLVLADGRMGDREKVFIDELQMVLQIDDATAAKIVDVLLVKNRD
jgi:hypothetical protein